MRYKKSSLLLCCFSVVASAQSAHAAEGQADNQRMEAEIQELKQRLDALTKQLAERTSPPPATAGRPVRPSVNELQSVRIDAAGSTGYAISSETAEAVAARTKPFIPPQFAPAAGQESPFTVGSNIVSFTPYGLVSMGLETVSNSGGKRLNEVVSGPQQLPRLGARLFWNVGNGTSALAVIEMGYSVTNGTLSQGGRIFGRQVYAGLSNETYGTITVGRQYDDVVRNVGWAESATNFATTGNHIGDNDNLFDTFRLNNSVQYTSPKIHHVSVSATYAFSNTSNATDNRAYSAGILYDNRVKGRGLRLGSAFLVLNRPVSTTNAGGALDNDAYGFSSPFMTSPVNGAGISRNRVAVAGSAYSFGKTLLGGSYSNVRFDYLDQTHLTLNNAEIFSTHYFNPKLLGGVGLIYTWGRYSANGDKPNYKQFNIGLDYFLNRYVDIFLVDTYQQAGGSARNAWIYNAGQSSSKKQNTVTGGYRIRF